MNVQIIGAGISGITAARTLADRGHRVQVFESRDHVGGNCYDERKRGVTVHKYGPHLFHTPDKRVWQFLSQYTTWNGYRHKVVADTSLGRISIPYSLKTEQQVGRSLTDDEIRQLIFIDYSEKQWGVPWSRLPANIVNRIPTRRENHDDCYFADQYQGQPEDGYTSMFLRMLEGISVHVGVRPGEWKKFRHRADLVIYTGKIDEYFDFRFGKLPYRSLRFEHQWSPVRLPHAVINQCNRLPYTRIYDHAHFSLETPRETLLTREYPEGHNDFNIPYYPMPFGRGLRLYGKYRRLAARASGTIFLGRLATYSYLDMWMAVAQVLTKLQRIPQVLA